MSSSRHLVITGASSGIGRAIALRLAGPNTTVSLLARRLPQLEETAALVSATGHSASAYACDVQDAASIRAAASHLKVTLESVSMRLRPRLPANQRGGHAVLTTQPLHSLKHASCQQNCTGSFLSCAKEDFQSQRAQATTMAICAPQSENSSLERASWRADKLSRKIHNPMNS